VNGIFLSILNRFDLLIEAGFAEANQDDDSEHRVARVGAVIGLLSSHYKLIAKGKPSDTKMRMSKFLHYVQSWPLMNWRQLNLATSSMRRMQLNLSAA